MNYCPESPHWLVKKGKIEYVKRSLVQIFQTQREDGQDELEREVADIQTCSLDSSNFSTLREKYIGILVTHREKIKMGAIITIFQFLCGYGTLNLYGVKLLLDLGFIEKGNNSLTLISCIVYNTAVCLGCFFAVIKYDHIGRRPILLRSILGEI